MRDLTGQVQRALEEMAVLQRGQRVAVALSGGRDSVCLLHVMRHVAPDLGLTLSAVHVNHGLRQEAGADEGLPEGRWSAFGVCAGAGRCRSRYIMWIQRRGFEAAANR